jgi:transposase
VSLSFITTHPQNGLNPKQGPQRTGKQPTEVTPKARRRTFSAQYKLRMLDEANRCSKPGEIGALLRREGLYSSNLTSWRRQRDQGQFGALSRKKRGPKPDPDAALKRELERLRKQNQRLEQRLQKAELIIEVQKKVSALLGLSPTSETP